MKNYYHILGISKEEVATTTKKDIILAAKLQTSSASLNNDDFRQVQKKLKDVHEALNVLGNEGLKYAYDVMLSKAHVNGEIVIITPDFDWFNKYLLDIYGETEENDIIKSR